MCLLCRLTQKGEKSGNNKMSEKGISRVFHDSSFNLQYQRNSQGDLPREVTFNSDSLLSVISYIILFVIGSIGNVSGKNVTNLVSDKNKYNVWTITFY